MDRWERLFADLEGRIEAEHARDLDAEVADRTRRERALLGLRERLAAACGSDPVTVRVAGLGRITARVADVGADWLLLSERSDSASTARRDRATTPAARSATLVPCAAIRSVGGLPSRATATTAVTRGFTFGVALRALSRDRAVVHIVDLDGTRVSGTIDAVGQDAFDLAEHASDEPRRPQHVIDVRVVPFGAVGAVLRAG